MPPKVSVVQEIAFIKSGELSCAGVSDIEGVTALEDESSTYNCSLPVPR